MDNSQVRGIFKEKNIKFTRQREMLYSILNGAAQPLSAEQLFFQLKEFDSTVSLSTIYRILEAFIEKALVNKANIADDNRALFELENNEHKHHLVCIICRKMIAVEGCPLEEYEKTLEKITNYKITGHNLELMGLCPQCQDSELV